MDNKALQLQSLDTEKRKAAVIATKEYNLAKVSHPGVPLDCQTKVVKTCFENMVV